VISAGIAGFWVFEMVGIFLVGKRVLLPVLADFLDMD
jgi:hypothetical protein